GAEQAGGPLRVALVRTSGGGEVPAPGEPDDDAHDDEAHPGVVEHRVRIERLAAILDVALVALESGAAFVERAHAVSPPLRRYPLRAAGCVRPTRPFVVTCPATDAGAYPPAASFDQGGGDTASRTKRYRFTPLSAKITS